MCGHPYADLSGGMSNDPLPFINSMLNQTLALGIPADQLVSGFPWYNCNFDCGRKDNTQGGVNCSKLRPKEFCPGANSSKPPYKFCFDNVTDVGYAQTLPLLAYAKAQGNPIEWDNEQATNYVKYFNESDEHYHAVWYDNPHSLAIKYKWAAEKGLRGIGIWTPSATLFDEDASRAMWAVVPTNTEAMQARSKAMKTDDKTQASSQLAQGRRNGTGSKCMNPQIATLLLLTSRGRVLKTDEFSGASRSAVVGGRLMLNGAPFFVNGIYTHDLNSSDWKILASSGFNTVLPYRNGNICSWCLPRSESYKVTASYLDSAADHNISVLLSLKDFYEASDNTGTAVPPGINAEEEWRSFVSAFQHHPAVLGYYLADEAKTKGLPAIARRNAAVRSMDPHHITFALLDGGIMSRAAKQDTTYHANVRNISTSLGSDAYPWRNSTLTSNLSSEVTRLRYNQAAWSGDDGRASINVAQLWNIAADKASCKKDHVSATCAYTEPPLAVKLAMSFLQPVLGTGGIIQYAYYYVFEGGNALHTASVPRRLSDLKTVGQALRSSMPIFHAKRCDERLKLLPSTHAGQNLLPSGVDNIFASLSELQSADSGGTQGKLALIVVNAQAINASVTANIEGYAKDLILLLGPWEVAIRNLKSE